MAKEKIVQITTSENELFGLTSLGNIFMLPHSQGVVGSWMKIELPELHEPKKRTTKNKGYGITGAVKMTEEEYESLCQEYSKREVDSIIDAMCEWLNKPGNKPYKSFKVAIHGWIKRERKRNGDTSGTERRIIEN